MHMALVCPEMTGHLNPMTTLGRALRRCGHRVTLLGFPESRTKADSAGLEFAEIGRPEHSCGELEADRAKLGQLRGLAAVRFTGQMLRKAASVVLRDAPDVFQAADIEGVVVDQVSPAGNSVAEMLDLPFAVVCNAMALNMESAVPPAVMSWRPGSGWLARSRNRMGNVMFGLAAKPVFDEVNTFRRRHGLAQLRPTDQVHGELIQVAQQPAFLDFPREQLPAHFHYTGPWHDSERDGERAFPWEKLDGRPLLYASLGTLQNRLRHLFATIISACSELDVQLVLSLGRPDAEWDLPFTSNSIVVPYAPQLRLLERATAVVSHAGLNTSLEALSRGLPMVAIPLTNDQPGVARRLEALGVAEVVSPRVVRTNRLRRAIRRVLEEQPYRTSAEHCQKQLRVAPNVTDAAALLGYALANRVRLTRDDAVLSRGTNNTRSEALGEGDNLTTSSARYYGHLI